MLSTTVSDQTKNVQETQGIAASQESSGPYYSDRETVEYLAIGLQKGVIEVQNQFHAILKNMKFIEHAQDIYQQLIKRDGNNFVSVEKPDSSIKLEEMNGSTLLSYGKESIKLENFSLMQVQESLEKDFISYPKSYSTQYKIALEQTLITKKDHYSAVTQLAANYVDEHWHEFGNDLKHATARQILLHPGEHSAEQISKMAQYKVLNTPSRFNCTPERSAEYVLDKPDRYDAEAVRYALCYGVCHSKPGSRCFELATKHLLKLGAQNCPGIATIAASQFVQHNNDFFGTAITNPTEFEAFYRDSGNIAVIENYSNQLRSALKKNPQVYEFEDGAKLTAEEQWEQGRFASAFACSKEREDVAICILTLREDQAIQSWNARNANLHTHFSALKHSLSSQSN